MPKFEILTNNPLTGERTTIVYSTDDSSLTTQDGVSLIEKSTNHTHKVATKYHIGKEHVRTLKIQLGLSCNFECKYCNQRFVPHSEENHQAEAMAFVAGMDSWLKQDPERIEFWGGEPFVYWKTMKPLAETLRKKFPSTQFSIITNGSLLTMEWVDWLDDLGFAVSVSHDGPGQFVRGPDPLTDPKTQEAILALFKRLAPKQRFSFNSMMNKSNTGRASVQSYFENLVGSDWVHHLIIGEGTFVDAYDEGGVAQSLNSNSEMIGYRQQAFTDIRDGKASRFTSGVNDRARGFIESIYKGVTLNSVNQKCGADQPDTLSVDLKGNVLTCQNVSSVSNNPSGISHLLGNVHNLAAVEMKTSTHWSDRKECPKCPMIHICKGACLFLTGHLWEQSCDNAYSDAVPIFAAGIEALTGLVPVYIDGNQRSDRKDIFGALLGVPEAPKKKAFPIPVVSI